LYNCTGNNENKITKNHVNDLKKDTIIELRTSFLKNKRNDKREALSIIIELSNSDLVVNKTIVEFKDFYNFMLPKFENYYLNRKKNVLGIKIYYKLNIDIKTYKLIEKHLKNLYLKIWDYESKNRFHKNFLDLTIKEQRIIKTTLPYYVTSDELFLKKN
jgi:hypothetical protein